MKITPPVNAWEASVPALQFFIAGKKNSGIERKCRASVRRSDYIGSTARGSDSQHFQRFVESCGTVVNAPEDMAVDINHRSTRKCTPQISQVLLSSSC